MNKILVSLVALLGLMVMVGGLAGCGESRYDVVSYYNPNWLPNGRIMAVKSVTKHRTEGWPGYGRDVTYSQADYIVSMNDDGSDEREIYGGENQSIGKIVASPLGNYIGYQVGQSISIITADGTQEVKTIDCGEAVNSFDWSPDEAKLAFSGDVSRDLCVLNVSGELKIKIVSPAYVVSWRMGDKLVYEGITQVYSINQDGTGSFEVIGSGATPQKIGTSEVVYMDNLFKLHRISIDGLSDSVLFSDYKMASLNLSFNSTKIVGGDLDQGIIGGVWVVNIDGTNLKKLRD
jgi:hypothetical protein